jgi:polyphosphate glucokinase
MASSGKTASSLRILAFDIGGTGLKAALLEGTGKMLSERLRIDTPPRATPAVLVQALVTLVAPLSGYTHVAAGFPGVVRRGVILTAPTLGNPKLIGFDIERALAKALGKPVRAVNDAEMQGFATIKGRGLELVVTLGTGFGSALFSEGRSTPHLELSTHGFRHDETYNEQLGDAALKEVGKKKWNHRVLRAIDSLYHLTHFDHLYLGGGNAANLRLPLPKNVSAVSNVNGLRGGAWVWREAATGPAKRPL